MTDNNLIRALVDVQRTQVVLAKLFDATASLIPDAYAFAIDKRLCPVFDTEDGHPFDDGYGDKARVRERSPEVL